MKILLMLLFTIQISFLYSQKKFELVFGLGPTYSITTSNISYFLEPDIFPTVFIEDARESNVLSTKTLDWINDKNYFGIEPSIEIGYDVGKELTFGFGVFGRNRQVEYDVLVPIAEGIPLYSHRFELDFYFIASTLYLKYRHPSEKWNMSFHLGFNHPLSKLDNLNDYYTIIGAYAIEERVVGAVKSDHGFTDFTLNLLARFALNRELSEKFEIGFFVEKQIDNEYGSHVVIDDHISNNPILEGTVFGRDIILGVKLYFKLKG